MRKLIPVFIVLLLISSAYAQSITTDTTSTTTTTGYGIQLPATGSTLKGVYDFLVSFNPVILIVLGVILLVAGKFAKFVGIVLIIIAVIHLLLMYL
jgi:hypothetical protein